PLRHQRLRLEGATASIDAAAGLLLDESTDDVARWYTPWLRRFEATRADLVRTKSGEAADDQNQIAQADLNSIDQDQARLARKLNSSNLENQLSGSQVVATDWLNLASLLQSPGRRAALSMIQGEGPLLVECPEMAIVDHRWQYTAAASVA